MSDINYSSLIELAVDLTSSLTSSDRFDRLLSTIRQTIACDAVVLLELQGEQLKPLAQQGLTADCLGRRFDVEAHPRFAAICSSRAPIRFPVDSPLPDPYDGMLLAHDGDLPVHACMGLPLLADDQIIGVLTLDSMTPKVFDEIPQRTLDIISLMSSATLKTAILLQQLEHRSLHSQLVVEELTLEALTKDGGELIGSSPVMDKLKRDIDLVAPSDFSVLIEGETGVGKELVARTIHRRSNRLHGPLVYVNCAAIPENLIESELFGHVKGAFTGADRSRAGKFSIANQGTIFLDEIGELPLAAQSKLLRVLQNKEIQPLGQDNTETVNTRVLAATNRQLKVEVEEGRFRADLYHRLSVYPIHIPPLRERGGDITLLSGYFCESARRKLGLRQLTLESRAIQRLQAYDWPGNVRELEHVISRAALIARGSSDSSIVRIKESQLGYLPELPGITQVQTSAEGKLRTEYQADSDLGLRDATDAFQRQLLLDTLHQEDGNWAAAARKLQVDRANLSRLAKRLGVLVNKSIVVNKNIVINKNIGVKEKPD
ncbi:nitric oxide reductase transcriptional regulator NorR [Hahella ganghwensis]|uniref:nitric oxide reductase transcriptional regulator NorR n=1 Tax=Hahella ganghwensis TaxID=286420 RepID=UPI00035E73D5|nr:nitric oxide reductase transcriptional regulator NorR [Hahella ganghwensis]